MSNHAASPSLGALVEDLAWNLGGHISAAQRAVLEQAASVRSVTGPVMAGLLLGLTGIVVTAVVMASAQRLEELSTKALLAGMAVILACVLGCAWPLVREARRRAALRSDIIDGRVAAFAGRVIWRSGISRDNYVLEPTDGSSAVIARWAPLPPGPYRAYCLPRSRVVIAAESTVVQGGAWSISLADPNQVGLSFNSGPGVASVMAQPFTVAPYVGDLVELLRAMSTALDFDAEDLGHNRRGTLSPRQVRRRIASAAIPFFFLSAFGLVPAALATFGLRLSTMVLAVPFLIAALICLWIRRDVFTRRVQMVEGIVERYVPRNVVEMMAISDSNDYYRALIVQGWKIHVSAPIFRAIVPKLRYRLYLAESTGRLLSVDPLDTTSTQPRGALRPEATRKAM